jgi:carbonic anhydrase
MEEVTDMLMHLDEPLSITAEQALHRLRLSNERFLKGTGRWRVSKEMLAGLTKGQRPYATILCCSDSRVPPELVFDAGFGELFVIRVAGNVITPEVSGSMQYAAAHLKTPLFVVLGHEGCGAIHATLDAKIHGIQPLSRVKALVDGILPALSDLDLQLPMSELLSKAVEANVRWTMHQVLESPEGRMRQKEGLLKLVGAIYEIESGRLRFLS